MEYKNDESFVKLRVARNLLVSSFYSLRNSASLLDYFHDEKDLDRVNHLLHKAKTRFETYKGVLEAAPKSIVNDMAGALIESFIEYYQSVREIVLQQSWEFSEYEGINNKYFENYFGAIDFDDFNSYKVISKKSMRFYHKLANDTNGANAYFESILIAGKVLSSIRLTKPSSLKVVREITFPPEFTQAGVGLLSYFSTIIDRKYPNIEVAVSIQQRGNTVTMTITHPDGKQEEIVHTLNNYGLVLTGKLQPEELFEDNIQVLALKHKLEMAKMEVSQVKEILELERNGSKSRIDALESEVESLRNLVGQRMQANESTQYKLIELFASHIEASKENVSLCAIQELGFAISERDAAKAELILDDMNIKEPELFEKLNTLITEGAISGVVGNSAFSWLQAIIASLPK